MSETSPIIIGEHTFIRPSLPTLKSEILFVDLKNKDAYWRREILIKEYRDIWFEFIPHETLMFEKMTTYDSNDKLTALNKEDSEYILRIYKQESDRRTHGVWFRNGEEFEYLTGDHYFLLMWAKMNPVDGGEYAGYREYQRDYFYLIKKVNESNKCLGLFVSKAKKTGITNLHWIYYLNKSTLYRNQNLGCMNINKDQAAKTFRDYFMRAFNGLPSPLKPQVKSKAEAEGRIDFGKAYTNSKANKSVAIQDPDDQLATSVFCVATAEKAFDVAVMNDIWMDEIPKYEESVEGIVNTNKEAVKIGAFTNGRMWLTSYTPEKDTQSFREARDLFENSELRTMKDTTNGKTKSELWCYHIPSYVSWFGEDGKCFDKNGKCDEARAIKEIDEGRFSVKDNPRKLQSLKRQYAKNKKEAWMSAGSGAIFDLNTLGEIEAKLLEDEREDQDALYEEGFLRWEKELWEVGLRNIRKYGEFCPVRFVKITAEEKANGKTAKFRKYYDVPVGERNLALQQGKDEYGNLLPPDKFTYAIGGDPTSYAASSELIQKSKNGGGAMRMPDARQDIRFQRIVTNVFSLEYYDRPELPSEAFEDFLKLIIYTGGVAIIEGNQEFVATRLMEEGMGYYMIVNDANKIPTLWKPYMGMALDPEKTYTFIKIVVNQTGVNKILNYMVDLFKKYFHVPAEGEQNLGETCKSRRLIKQMMDFNVKDTKEFDLFMAWGYALMACDIYQILITAERNEYEDPVAFSGFLHSLGIDV